MVKKAETPQNLDEMVKAYSEEWDTERHASQIADLEMHLSKTNMYITTRLKEEMDLANKAPVMAVKTKTFVDTGKVWVTSVAPATSGARKVRSTKSMYGAYFGFGIPLKKLGIRLPAGRRFNFKVTPVDIEGATVYEISFAEFENVRRHIDEAKLAAARKTKLAKAKARRVVKSTPAPDGAEPD